MELISGDFDFNFIGAYRAMTDLEIGNGTLRGCVLVWVPVSGSLG